MKKRAGVVLGGVVGGVVWMLSAVAGAAEPMVDLNQPRPGVVRYDGHVVVRVWPESVRELNAALAMAEEVWSERVGVGPIEIQVLRETVEVLREAGLEPVVLIEDVQALVDEEWALMQQAAGQRGATFYNTFRQLAEINARVASFAADFPAIARTEVIGQSIEGRDIVALRVTAPETPGNLIADRPTIILNGCQHAREWVSPMTVTYLAEQMVTLNGIVPQVTEILQRAELVFVPMMNPDGYLYTWTNQRLWRKNRRGGFGVDLNRNWGFEWGGEGSSGSQSSDIYRGPSPFSEPETQALRDLAIAEGNVIAHIDYHSFSQLILTPWGYDFVLPDEPDASFFDELGQAMSGAMLDVGGEFYVAQPAHELYPAAGAAPDWFYGELGAKSLTIELRDTGTFGFTLPPDQILPTVTENYAAMLVFLDRVTRPVNVVVTAGLESVVPADEAILVDLSIGPGVSDVDPMGVNAITRINGGAEQVTPVMALGGTDFRVTLPGLGCGDVLSLRFEIGTLDGQTVNFPAGGAFDTVAQDESVLFEDTVELGTNGWVVNGNNDTATTGIWGRMNPEATAAQPEDDHTPTGTVCWITDGRAGTGLGAFDVDGGTTTLTSPALDATATEGEAFVVYHRWYSNNTGGEPNSDSMPVLISNDNGQTWTLVESVSENLNRWERKEFRVADFVTPTSQVRLRFIARDLGGGSIVEAGVDDVQVVFRGCIDASSIGDWNSDGTLDFFDVQAFLADFGNQDPRADLNDDGSWDFFDVQVFLSEFANG